MSEPRLIVSVTGGAQSFYMQRRLLENFKQGLMKVATTPGPVAIELKSSIHKQRNSDNSSRLQTVSFLRVSSYSKYWWHR